MSDPPAPAATAEGPRPGLHSILFPDAHRADEQHVEADPASFADLHLDQIAQSLTSGREQYDLRPFLCAPLRDIDSIHYRHEVFHDLADRALVDSITAFAQSMNQMRAQLAQAAKLRHRYQKERIFLDAVDVYCKAVTRLASDLARANTRSRAFLGLAEYVSQYLRSPAFLSLVTDMQRLKERLAQVHYCLHIKGARVSVRRYDSEGDYSAEVQHTFERFKQGAGTDYRVHLPNYLEMNHVEESIIDLVARLYNDIFSELDDYCARNAGYLDGTVRRFDREVQFYLAYLDHIQPLVSAGLHFSYPEVSRESKEIRATDTFDLALAHKLLAQHARVVCNDFHLTGVERILVVSGPNQGGKTTFARTFGQLHHLAAVGYPVPGSGAQLFLFDRLFTHFTTVEDLDALSGKLEDDLVRIRDILVAATPDSVVVINEIFSSTTLNDAVLLGTRVMEAIIELDLLCVYVTFVDELASLGESTVSMVATVVPEHPAQRTYKVLRRPADGLAYALAIAEQYGLTYGRLRDRIRA